MDRVDVEDLSRADDRGNVQITLRGRCWSNAGGFVGEANVQRIAIDVAVNGDLMPISLQVQMTRRDLAAIGDQDLLNLRGLKAIAPQKSTKGTN